LGDGCGRRSGGAGRHPLKSSLSFGLVSNPLILLGIAAELGLILFIVYTQAGNWLLGTAPVGPEVWSLAVVFSLSMWALEEARKVWLRWTARRRCRPAAAQ